jgi:hypothetical protein
MQMGARSFVAVVAAAGMTMTVAGPSVAGTPAGSTSAGATPAGATPAGVPPHSSRPAVRPRQGKPFVPVTGDWEGTADGFAASFELTLVRQGGTRRYGVQDLVLLTPQGCPPTPAHYRESLLTGHAPSPLARFGSLGLSRLGLQGSLGGPRSASLSAGYRLPGCHGTLAWHMRPATRTPVADGGWTAHFAGGESSRFQVQAGGRLATGVGLPRNLLACNGVQGAVDMFIGPSGLGRVSGSGVTLMLRFSGNRATGSISARGCPGGAHRVTATHAGG